MRRFLTCPCGAPRVRAGKCLKCLNTYQRAHYQKHREVIIARQKDYYNRVGREAQRRAQQTVGFRAHQLARKYGVTDNYAMYLLSIPACMICGRTDDLPLHTDHCHDSEVVRGRLCKRCNRSMGAFRDDPDLIRKVLIYLEGKLSSHMQQRKSFEVMPGVTVGITIQCHNVEDLIADEIIRNAFERVHQDVEHFKGVLVDRAKKEDANRLALQSTAAQRSQPPPAPVVVEQPPSQVEVQVVEVIPPLDVKESKGGERTSPPVDQPTMPAVSKGSGRGRPRSSHPS